MSKLGVRAGAACVAFLMATALASNAQALGLRIGGLPGALLSLPFGGHRLLHMPRQRMAARSRSYRSHAGRRVLAAAPAAAAAAAAPAAEPVRMGSARSFSDLLYELNEFCTDQAADLQNWPSDRVTEILQPDDGQRAKLKQVQSTASLAADALSGVCQPHPSESSIVRLGLLQQEIEFVTQALDALRSPLGEFYDSLNAEQQERLTGATALASTRRERERERTNSQPGLALACVSYSRVLANWPERRLDRALGLNAHQRAALGSLRGASRKGAEVLIRSCPGDNPTTPPDRLEVMRKRLDAIRNAVGIVTPAFGQFYESLSDGQKGRFEQLSENSEHTAAFNP